MLKRLRDTAIAALVGACILSFGIAVWSASSCEPREKTEQTTADQKAHNETCNAFKISPFKGVGVFLRNNATEIAASISAIATIFIALFTLTLKRSTDNLWEITNNTLKHSEKTAERQLRAYVFPIEAELKKLSADEFPELEISIENSGQTPAYQLTHTSRFALSDFPLIEPLPLAEASKESSKTNVEPGGKFMKYGRSDRKLSAEAITQLKDGTAAIYAYGEIKFVDAFGASRWVKYRLMNGGRAGFFADGKLVACEEGNETSEDKR
jgi:hypothetical protein